MILEFYVSNYLSIKDDLKISFVATALKESLSEPSDLIPVSDTGLSLVRSAVIRNAGKDAAEIAKAFSFCTELPDTCGTYSALRLAGSWARERTPVITPLAEGTLRIESARGYSSHQMNPFSDLPDLFFVQQHFRQRPYHFRELLMSIDIRLALVVSTVHILADDTQHPDDPKQVVDMLMGHDNMVNAVRVDACLLQPA